MTFLPDLEPIMKPSEQSRAFVDSLATFNVDNWYNPWSMVNDHDADAHGPERRRALLARHLDTPGVRLIMLNNIDDLSGSHQTGVPMTNELMIRRGLIPGLHISRRLTSTTTEHFTPNTSFMWVALWRYGLAAQTLCWNILPFFYRRPKGARGHRLTRDDLDIGRPWLIELLGTHPGIPIISIGSKTQEYLRSLDLGDRAVYNINHPSRGGIKELTQHLSQLTETGVP